MSAIAEVMEFPLSSLIYSMDDRAEDELSSVSALTDSLKRVGQTTPIIVARTEVAGEYRILAGKRRYRAAKAAGLENLTGYIWEGENPELVVITDNAFNRAPDPIRWGKMVKAWLDNGLYASQKEVAAALGVSQPQISRWLQLVSLSPEVQAAVTQGVISQVAAREEAKKALGEETEPAPSQTVDDIRNAARARAWKPLSFPVGDAGGQHPSLRFAYRADPGEVRMTVTLSKVALQAKSILDAIHTELDKAGGADLDHAIHSAIDLAG